MINEIVDKMGVYTVIHVLLSFVIAVVACDIAHFFTEDKWLVGGIGYLAFFILGMAKELLDEKKKGNADNHDWRADLVGGLLGVVVGMTMMM